MGGVLAAESRRLLHDAKLSPREVEDVVSRLVLLEHAVDLDFLVRHGLDDHHHWYVPFETNWFPNQ